MRLLILLLTASLSPALAGVIVFSDLANPTIETYSGLDSLFPLNCSGVACQFTPLTINGISYTSSTGALRYFSNNSGCPGGDNSCLNTSLEGAFIDITFPSPVLAVGGFVFPAGVEFDFFDASNTLLGTTHDVNGFGGWTDPGGIARMRIIDQADDDSSFFFDSLSIGTVGGAPEPASLLLVCAGLAAIAAIGGRRPSRRTASTVPTTARFAMAASIR